jgi:glycine oxidase
LRHSREIPDKGLRNRWAEQSAARKSLEPDPVHTGVGIGFLARPAAKLRSLQKETEIDVTWRRDTPLCVGEPLRPADAPQRAADPPPAAQPDAADVAIVGAGVIGLSIAWRLAAAGLAVTVFDRGDAGASLAATGMLAAATELEPGGADLLALALESRSLWPRYRAELESQSGIDIDYRREGILTVALGRDEVDRLKFRHDLQARAGLTTHWLDGPRVRAMEPALRPSASAGIFCADDHQVDPRCLIPALRRALAARGGRLMENLPVLSLDIAGGRVGGVVTPQGLCRAPIVIVANGAWACEILGDALAVPVRPLKGQALALRSTARTGTPATVEECGFDRTVTAGGVFALLEGARRAFPCIEDMEIEAIWTGFRPTSDDDAPILGATRMPGLVLATGHHRNGILLAPVTAQAIHDLVVGGVMPGAAAGFGLDRFAGSDRRNGRNNSVERGAGLPPQEQTHAAQYQR